MDIYSIYTYEIHEGDKSLLYKDTGQKAIDRAHDIVSPPLNPEGESYWVSRNLVGICI